jgi:hypothetical protein
MSEKKAASSVDIAALAMVGLRLVLELIKLWRENRDAVSKEDIEGLRTMVDKDKSIFS